MCVSEQSADPKLVWGLPIVPTHTLWCGQFKLRTSGRPINCVCHISLNPIGTQTICKRTNPIWRFVWQPIQKSDTLFLWRHTIPIKSNRCYRWEWTSRCPFPSITAITFNWYRVSPKKKSVGFLDWLPNESSDWVRSFTDCLRSDWVQRNMTNAIDWSPTSP